MCTNLVFVSSLKTVGIRHDNLFNSSVIISVESWHTSNRTLKPVWQVMSQLLWYVTSANFTRVSHLFFFISLMNSGKIWVNVLQFTHTIYFLHLPNKNIKHEMQKYNENQHFITNLRYSMGINEVSPILCQFTHQLARWWTKCNPHF